MKILNKISMALLLSGVTATPLFATTLSVGGTLAAVPVTAGTFTLITGATTGKQAFSFGGTAANKDKGFVEEEVGFSTANPFGPTALTFEYQFSVTKGDVSDISGSDFTGYLTDVSIANGFLPGFAATATHLKPSTANRSGVSGTEVGANVGFSFNSGALVGATSYILIINTDATAFDKSSIGLLDSGGETLKGFEPTGTPIRHLGTVPEPSSLFLLGTGLVGIGATVRRRFSIQRA